MCVGERIFGTQRSFVGIDFYRTASGSGLYPECFTRLYPVGINDSLRLSRFDSVYIRRSGLFAVHFELEDPYFLVAVCARKGDFQFYITSAAVGNLVGLDILFQPVLRIGIYGQQVLLSLPPLIKERSGMVSLTYTLYPAMFGAEGSSVLAS